MTPKQRNAIGKQLLKLQAERAKRRSVQRRGYAAHATLLRIINRSRPRVFGDYGYKWTVRLPMTDKEYTAFNAILKGKNHKAA